MFVDEDCLVLSNAGVFPTVLEGLWNLFNVAGNDNPVVYAKGEESFYMFLNEQGEKIDLTADEESEDMCDELGDKETNYENQYKKLECHWVPGNTLKLADGTPEEWGYKDLEDCFLKCNTDPKCLGFLDRSPGNDNKICAWKSDESTLAKKKGQCHTDYYKKRGAVAKDVDVVESSSLSKIASALFLLTVRLLLD
jgi:hypothetical protein